MKIGQFEMISKNAANALMAADQIRAESSHGYKNHKDVVGAKLQSEVEYLDSRCDQLLQEQVFATREKTV